MDAEDDVEEESDCEPGCDDWVVDFGEGCEEVGILGSGIRRRKRRVDRDSSIGCFVGFA